MRHILEYNTEPLTLIGGKLFILEECKDFEKGLSNRKHLRENQGMLFKFPNKKNYAFHMKDCLIPLDIIFIESGVIKKIFHECPPCTEEPCKEYEYGPTDSVIELLGGTCKKNNIKEGLNISLK